MVDIDAIVATVRSEGLVVLDDVLSQEECSRYRERLDRQLEERLARGSDCGNETYQVLDNYFQTDADLLELIYQDVTHEVMRRLIDADYVLISPSARNRCITAGRSFGAPTSGVGWHNDSRVVGGRGVQPSLCYMSILSIDEFTATNGATHYVPRSHLRYERPPDRDAALDFQSMVVPRGGMVIFDTALWHRVGEPTTESRWGVFNTYGPWFMKPYHRFHEMFPADESSRFRPIIRQLLHLDSIPPRDHDESRATLRRVREQLEREAAGARGTRA
jgi:ectoine hydroxylase-related dioxygenase (phytanoyl-CoA dioxygenase family)